MFLKIEANFLRPCQRPRKGKFGNIYSPSKKNQNDLAMIFLSQRNEFNILYNTLYVEYPVNSLQDGDIDNYLKNIMDALQKADIVKNDKQIRNIFVYQNEKIEEFVVIKLFFLNSINEFAFFL